VIEETDLPLADGRTLHCYDSGGAGARLTVFWHHGGRDRMVPSAHGAWLASHCNNADLWLSPEDGHVSVLGSRGVAALDWLAGHA
jgi:hypothetical protein